MGLYLSSRGELDMYYMFIDFVGMQPWQARLLVAAHGHGLSDRKKLAGYHSVKTSHLDTHMYSWGKRIKLKGREYHISLHPDQIERFRAAAYACFAAERLNWRKEDFDVGDLEVDDHFEELKLLASWEKDHKIEEADIPTYDGVPKMGDRDVRTPTHLLLKLQEFLPTVCGESGIPLSYVIRPKIFHKSWSEVNHARASSYNAGQKTYEFFDFDSWRSTMVRMADITQPRHLSDLRSNDPLIEATYESGKNAKRRSAMFQRDTALVYAIMRHALKDTAVGVLFPPVGVDDKTPCARRQYFLAHSTYLGAEHLRETANECRRTLGEMRYSGESRSWNWIKHTTRFIQTLELLQRIARQEPGHVTTMTDSEAVTAFLQTISDDCTNKALTTSLELVRADSEKYNTVTEVLGQLRRTIPSLIGGAGSGGGSGGKRRIAATESDNRHGGGGRNSRDNRSRTGRGNSNRKAGEWGKLRKTSDGKGVQGQVENLRYCNDCFQLMSNEQKQQVRDLRKTAAARKQSEVTTSPSTSEDLMRRIAALERDKGSSERSSERDRGRHHQSRSRSSERRSHRSRDDGSRSRSRERSRRPDFDGTRGRR